MEGDLNLLTQFSEKRKTQARIWFRGRYAFYKEEIGRMKNGRISIQMMLKKVKVESDFPEDSILYHVVNTHAIRKVMEELDDKKWKKHVLYDAYDQFVDMQCVKFETVSI